MELGKKIRQLRFKAGLTQEMLADRMGLSPQSVSKWETGAAMPDITSLPLLAEIFGVTIDDLFDLSTEQRLNRIENRLDTEEDLPQDIFLEYEEFLKPLLQDETLGNRAVELTAYLYWHKMDSYARKTSRFAAEAVRRAPGEKNCQWMLMKTDGHACWDWNMHNHTAAIDFWREIADTSPDLTLPQEFLIDNLLADRRADEAEKVLEHLSGLKNFKPVLRETYMAHIALARFNEQEADRIIENMLAENPDNSDALFEAAQYYASKTDYDKAIACYENAFECDERKPRFQDALMAISDIYRIMGDYQKAADTYDRIITLLREEWGMSEEVELKTAIDRKNALLAKL